MMEDLHEAARHRDRMKVEHKTLAFFIPEVNVNQWKMLRGVFVHDLDLTPEQESKLDYLLGVDKTS